MTSQPATRRPMFTLPGGTTIRIASAALAIGVISGALGQRTFDNDQPSAVVAPAPGADLTSLYESLGDLSTSAGAPSTGIAPGSGVTNDAIQPSAAERRMSPTGRQGVVDFDPAVPYTNIAPGSGVTNRAIQPSAAERRMSPTGSQGFRDFDPDILYPSAS